MADPWLKFYPQDWRADERLRNCGLAARGLWMEMLALMHRSERYGHLLINGKSPSDRQLAVQVGATADEVAALLSELEAEAVFSRDRHGAIYSRRMIRDEKRANHARKIGKKGGNPKLGKQTENSAQDNGQDKPEDNGVVKPQIPEARSQSSEDKSSGQSPKNDPVKNLFDLGIEIMTESGLSEKDARSVIGKWRKANSDGEVMAGLFECRTRAVTNPVEWLTKRFNGGGYVSASGYRYRGDEDAVMREAEKRNDMDTYWRAKAARDRQAA